MPEELRVRHVVVSGTFMNECLSADSLRAWADNRAGAKRPGRRRLIDMGIYTIAQYQVRPSGGS